MNYFLLSDNRLVSHFSEKDKKENNGYPGRVIVNYKSGNISGLCKNPEKYQVFMNNHYKNKDCKEILFDSLNRLNDEFISFGLSEVMLSEEQLESLRDMYEKKSNKIQGGSAGSHYRITGPFIIPSIKQPLSPLLICDRWVALSVFSRMQKIPHIKDL